jgi:hypothetical protein
MRWRRRRRRRSRVRHKKQMKIQNRAKYQRHVIQRNILFVDLLCDCCVVLLTLVFPAYHSLVRLLVVLWILAFPLFALNHARGRVLQQFEARAADNGQLLGVKNLRNGFRCSFEECKVGVRRSEIYTSKTVARVISKGLRSYIKVEGAMKESERSSS